MGKRQPAIRRSVRTGVVTLAAFAIGRWGLGNVTAGVFATFTALAITGIADYGGSIAGRATAICATTVLAIALTALGTSISNDGLLVGCAAMFGVVATIAMCALLGGYAAAGANASILFYVVAAGSPAPVTLIPDRLAGVALGGALALVAAVGLWPEPEHPQTLRHLGLAIGDLAARLSGWERRAGDQAELLRATVDGLADRPAGPTSRQRAELYLVNDVERLGRLVVAVEQGRAVREHDESTLQDCAQTLRVCADALRGCGAPPAAGEAPTGAPFDLVTRLVVVTDAIRSHTADALGRGSAIAALAHSGLRFKANLTLRSVHVHDALRLGIGLALALAAVNAFGLQHGFWVAFASLTVIKSNLRATGRSVLEAIVGTLLGVALAFGLIAALEPSLGCYVALLPIVVTVAIYANVAVGFLAGQAGFTLAIIVLFNLLGPAGWAIGIVRVIDVAAGALAGLAVAALAWPRGASATIGPTIADLIDAAAPYVATTARDRLGGPSRPRLEGTRRRTADAAVRAESAFAQFLTEHPSPRRAAGWAHWLSTGNRLWYAADLIAAAPPESSPSPAQTAHAADGVVDRYRSLSQRLRLGPGPPQPDGDQPVARDGGLAGWLDELGAAGRFR